MAMFELEDSDEVKLDKCRTDGGTILSGKRLNKVEAHDCEAKKEPSLPPPTIRPHRSWVKKSIGWIMGIVGAVIAACIAGWLQFS